VLGCEQVKPEVDAALQGQLEAMGFSGNKAVRALHFTGTSSLEQAVAWLVEHGEDADIDTPLLIPKVR
jgi:UBX domain-containing protein 1/4